MDQSATADQLAAVTAKIGDIDSLRAVEQVGVRRTVVSVIGDFNGGYETLMEQLASIPGVENVERISSPFKLVSRKESEQQTVIDVGHNVSIGETSELSVVAGPCSIESEEQLDAIAHALKEAGANILRGGAFKPRTLPRDFQGLGRQGLEILQRIGERYEMPTQTEVMDQQDISLVADHANILQVGARNMQNYTLLDGLGKISNPVVLKRGGGASIDEWLGAAERIMDGGNHDVILCERGIKGIDLKYTRNMADFGGMLAAMQMSHLPMMFDPSHAAGKPQIIAPLSLAGVAAGVHSVHIEVHNKPEEALTDGQQALRPIEFTRLMEQLKAIHSAVQASACDIFAKRDIP